MEALANNQSLDARCHDRALSGRRSDHRDCYVKPDVVLMYRRPDANPLRLVRPGSSSELGL